VGGINEFGTSTLEKTVDNILEKTVDDTKAMDKEWIRHRRAFINVQGWILVCEKGIDRPQAIPVLSMRFINMLQTFTE